MEADAPDVLTALVVMTPTMSEYFEAWKNSRFIARRQGSGEGVRRAFAAEGHARHPRQPAQRLSGVKPLIARSSAAQATRSASQLMQLSASWTHLCERRPAGKQFKPDEADLLGSQAQKQANAIAGQISQVAGKLGIELQA